MRSQYKIESKRVGYLIYRLLNIDCLIVTVTV